MRALTASPIHTLAAALGFVVFAACAHTGEKPHSVSKDTSDTSAAPANGGANQPAAPPILDAAAEAIQPPDGKWLVDEQGRSYYLTDVPRVEGHYKWVDADKKQVRVAYGLVFDVADYDEHTIHIKVYKPEPHESAPPKRRADPAEIAREYAFTTPTTDRLSFRAFGDGLPTTGQWREGFTLADMNGDGFLDIVSGPARKSGSRPAIFLGDGAGHWRSWKEATFPPIPFDYGDAAAGDLDGDGHADLVLASHLRGITALVQDGQGHFRPWSTGIEFSPPGGSNPASAFSSRAIALADWNGDGRLDIVALGEGPLLMQTRSASNVDLGSRGLVTYLNNGDGTWLKVAAGKGRFFGDALQVADVDGDGRLDVVIAPSVQGFKSLLLHGLPDGLADPTAVDGVRPKSIMHSVAVGDVDRDGRADVLLGYQSFEAGVWRSGVDALLATSEGGFRRVALANEESMDGIKALALGDLDGDGRLDAVALTGAGEGWVFLGDGKGGFARLERTEIGHRGCPGSHVELVDLDRDGTAEAVLSFAGEGSVLGQQLQTVESCTSGGSLNAWKAVRNSR